MKLRMFYKVTKLPKHYLFIIVLFTSSLFINTAQAEQLNGQLDAKPRIAIMSAFEPELAILLNQVQQAEKYTVNGVEFTTGKLANHDVVLLLSGISMVNAAMNTQLLFDKFNVQNLLFSGIAGGVNPDLDIGDVSVPERWGQYLESVYMRETAPGEYQAPSGKSKMDFAAYGMMQPRPVRVRSKNHPAIEHKFWFDVDPQMLAVANQIKDVDLKSCDTENRCIQQAPQLVVGGNGVSGQVFVDNADFRKYAFDTFAANVLDMESAACAMVAYSNDVPFLAFRSLSDLAGGGAGENEMYAFMNIAAENASNVLLAFLKAWPISN